MDTVAKVTFLGEQLLEIGGAALLKNNQAEDARTIPYDAAFIRMENDAATLSLGEQLLSSPEFEVQQVHAFVWRNLEIRVKPLEKMHVTSILEHGCMILSDGFSGLEKEAKGQHEAYRSGLPEHERVKVVPWEGLPEYLKESNRLGVLHGQVKAALWNTFKDGNTAERDAIFEHLSKCEHNRWVAEKVTLGHVYHAQRDDKRKRHPSIVPWTGLSEAEKEKDRVQVRRVLGIPA
jgi:hypothetical protein